MMRNRTINFAKSDARPEDIKGTIGVSDRFADPKLKEAIAEQMRAPQAPAAQLGQMARQHVQRTQKERCAQSVMWRMS